MSCYNISVRVSLVVTVKNEADAITRLTDSILAQSRMPDEIVVADGGSSDGTGERLRRFASRMPIKILCVPGSNISQGRNAAIRAASGEIICSTDAGVRLDPNWVEELMKPFDAQADGGTLDSSFVPHPSALDIASGFFIPDPQSPFETALAATTLPALSDIRPEKFLPSSRSVAFRRAAWEQVGGYPEWLDFCEDLIFDLALRAKNFRFQFVPNARVYFRPRQNLRAFFKQYYQYARGDGKANLWFFRHMIRYMTYLIALPLLLALTIVSPLVSIAFWAIAALALFYTPYKRLLAMFNRHSLADRVQSIAWIPIIRVTGDIAKMVGYPVGVAWRITNRR